MPVSTFSVMKCGLNLSVRTFSEINFYMMIENKTQYVKNSFLHFDYFFFI